MKKISLFLLLSMFILSSCGDQKKINASDVPQPAVSAFATKYPGATNVQWVTEKKKDSTIYEAQFKMNDKKIEAEFDAAGNFLEEE